MATSKKTANWLIIIGIVLIAAALTIAAATFYPVVKEEVRYRLPHTQESLIPIDRDFGVVIPKLGANARIIANVDPYDSKIYQAALARGVAHARGTVFPGQPGSIFLFSHSSADFYRATQFNSVFYLINKLEPGDPIDLYYKGEKYTYRVTTKKIVEASAVSYLSGRGNGKMLILMTCWPPGTTLKRLLVFAELTSPK